MSEDAYRRAIDRAYRELPGEARPATPATPTFEDKQRALAATMQVPPDRLVDLARARALAVVEALVVNEGVEEGRVQCDERAFEQARSDAPRAELELR